MDWHSAQHEPASSSSTEPLLSHRSPPRSPTEETNRSPKMATGSVATVLLIINFGIFLTSVGLLIYSSIYVRKPGPTSYYSHFSCLYLSACLTFQTLQIGRLTTKKRQQTKLWGPRFVYVYLALLSFSGLVDGIAFCFTPKPDVRAVAFLTFTDGIVGIIHKNLISRREASKNPQHDIHTAQPDVTAVRKPLSTRESLEARAGAECLSKTRRTETSNSVGTRQSRIRICSKGFLKVGNRILMVLHLLLVLITTAGAVELALLYRYANPGTIVPITLASGRVHNLNYNCTSVRISNSSQPTIWLEADAAHGIVDFLGLQTILATDHGRNSCSYDPPNFGWSDRLPSDIENYFDYFNPLLKAIAKENEEMVLVGWGGGAENALMHSIQNNKSTKALVIMDASPDGIEWMDAKRKNNWTETQMLDYRATDLNGRVFLAETILGLGIPWGLMPVFIPANSTGYFDQSLFPRFRAQGMKEDIWAYQYYVLLQETSTSIDNYLVNTTAPEGIAVYTIMTYDAGSPSTDTPSNDFYRETKLNMVNHIAGGNLTAPVVWCNSSDCSLGFPVDKPGWTADALISLGI